MGSPEELESELEQRGWTRRVKAHHNPEYDKEYIPSVIEWRKINDGREGIITDLSNAHGLCFTVWFNGGSWAAYEPCELEQIPKKTP